FLDQHKYDDAKSHIENALGLAGSSEEAYIKLGVINESQGRYQAAESYYQKVLDLNPKHTIALTKMSNLQNRKGNLIASKEWYNKALESDSLNTIIEYGLFNYVTDNRINNKTAEYLFLKAIDYKPHYSSVYVQYADYLSLKNTNRKRLILADSMYSKAIRKNPHDVLAYAGKGWLYKKLNNTRKAVEIFKKGIENNPNKPEAFYNTANFYNEGLKDYKTAETYYLKALDKDKFYLQAYSKLVTLYNKQRKQNTSITLLNNLIKENPKAPDFWNLLGDTYFSINEYQKAIDAFNKAIELDETYSKSYSNLGYSALQVNNFDSAKTYYQKANAFAPYKNPKSEISATILTMAKNKEKFGTPTETKALYKLAFEIDESVISGLPYATYLYLNNEPALAFEKAKLLHRQDAPDKLKVENLKLLVKAAIDNQDTEHADLYFNILLKKNTIPDFLFASVYYRFKGDYQKGNALIRKSNPQLLRSNKLKEIYSQNTINNYILDR
ncbi:MAG: tetratricopeptide repeat protein, partial [Flavobacteriaceae bacterium]|nr:tetratricopeptide repeat protein [Flavobacteriaceae bacterium]